MTRPAKLPSSLDVARHAGVSQSAVSRAFTPGACVSEATREKVMAAAEALGYQPNLIPRIMATGRSNIVAVVVGGLYNPFYASALERFSGALQAAEKQVMLVQVASDRALDEIVGELAGYRVDAIVSALSIQSRAVAGAIDRSRIRVVAFNSDITSEWSAAVNSNNESAGEEIARLLHARGGRRFGFIAGPLDSVAQRERELGFRRGLEKLGVKILASAQGDYRHAGGYEAAKALFGGKAPPDALFCANDLTAFGVIDALREEFNLSVPGDVLVAGYDNIDAASWPAYNLTTFDQNLGQMTQMAVDLLAGEWRGRVSKTAAATLFERASTGRCGAQAPAPITR